MFHVNAWGLPYACPLVGARMVMPGPRLDGASLYEQFERERVTFASGVPTIWFGLLNHLKETGRRPTSLRRVVIGGAAAPRSMIETFEQDYGIEVLHGWGMTEMSPVGAVCSLNPTLGRAAGRAAPPHQAEAGPRDLGGRVQDRRRARPAPAPRRQGGGRALRARALDRVGLFPRPAASAEAIDAEGWFSTGDVATIDPRRLHADHRPRQGHDPLGRRMDQLDRARERRGRPSRPRRGGGDRGRPSASGASARC